MTLSKLIKTAMTGAIAAMGLSIAVSAQILIIDSERVEKDAAAYKDFSLQTTEVREQMILLRKIISRGGQAEQGFADINKRAEAAIADLDKRKALIGADKYEEQRKTELAKFQAEAQNLERTVKLYQQQLQRLEYIWDQLLQEVAVQVELVRQPIYRGIVKSHKAQVILPKRLVLASASGLDVTTEYIELLDTELPTVTLTKLPVKKTDAAAGAPAEVPVAKAK